MKSGCSCGQFLYSMSYFLKHISHTDSANRGFASRGRFLSLWPCHFENSESGIALWVYYFLSRRVEKMCMYVGSGWRFHPKENFWRKLDIWKLGFVPGRKDVRLQHIIIPYTYTDTYRHVQSVHTSEPFQGLKKWVQIENRVLGKRWRSQNSTQGTGCHGSMELAKEPAIL